MRKKYFTQLRQDLFYTTFLILFAAVIAFVLQLKIVATTFLFFIFPSVYLILVKPKSLRRIFTAASAGIIFGVIFDMIGSLNRAWYVPESGLIFHYRILGVVTIDGIIWFFGWVLFLLTFYEHFIDHDRSSRLSRHFKYAVTLSVLILILLAYLVLVNSPLITLTYAYIILICINIPILCFAIIKSPHLIVKFSQITIYFFFVFLLFELIGLKNNQWVFNGLYVNKLSLFGFILPFEEFFFWIILSGSVVLSYYELFVDDGK